MRKTQFQEVTSTFSVLMSPWHTLRSWHWATACSSWNVIQCCRGRCKCRVKAGAWKDDCEGRSHMQTYVCSGSMLGGYIQVCKGQSVLHQPVLSLAVPQLAQQG